MRILVLRAELHTLLQAFLRVHRQGVEGRRGNRLLVGEGNGVGCSDGARGVVRCVHHIQVGSMRTVVAHIQHNAPGQRTLQVHVVHLHQAQAVVGIYGVCIFEQLAGATETAGEREVGGLARTQGRATSAVIGRAQNVVLRGCKGRLVGE